MINYDASIDSSLEPTTIGELKEVFPPRILLNQTAQFEFLKKQTGKQSVTRVKSIAFEPFAQDIHNSTRPRTSNGRQQKQVVNLRQENDARRIQRRPASSSGFKTSKSMPFQDSYGSVHVDDSKNSFSTDGIALKNPFKISQSSYTGNQSLMGADGDSQEPPRQPGSSLPALSMRDRAALDLGRLIFGTVLDQPKVSTSDAVARFFFDSWLCKSGSSVKTADVLSIELLCELQKMKAVADFEADGEGEETTDSFSRAVESRAALCQTAFDSLERMAAEFVQSNPILNEVAGVLEPMIFVSLPGQTKEGPADGDV